VDLPFNGPRHAADISVRDMAASAKQASETPTGLPPSTHVVLGYRSAPMLPKTHPRRADCLIYEGSA